MNDEILFHQAVAQPAQERAAFLDAACAGDEALHRRVEALLLAHETPGSFLQAPAVQLSETTDSKLRADGDPNAEYEPAPGEESGRVIGPYKLLEQIGEGGMGTVWMAEQTEPVRRKVALKIIKAGMDSRQVLIRFEAERQALALMDHPNIARVLDAGTTPEGRPYFAMELVKGEAITKYCDEQRLTPRQRLELFVPVCQAIQHAHQKGIIHRDVKPSNVLVASYDGRPVVKVIDFGIAKATGQQLTERTLITEVGAVVGTLEYMSPEQAEARQLDIDTRSDIYSLGVLLYELLTGTTPLERKRLKMAALLEVLRLIREEEPPRPSSRLSTTEELPAIAANRGMEPKRLSGLMRGELDWIVMKALDKDRNRRYETANGFAADVQRYLNDEPVQACPPSRWYRFRKFARRNMAVLTTAGLVAVALLLGTGVSVWQAVQATQARDAVTQSRKTERQTQATLDRERTETDQQRSRINREISEVLVELAGLHKTAKAAGLADARQWAALREARKQAETLMASEGADPLLLQKVRTLLDELKPMEADRRTLARLEGLRCRSTHFDDKRAPDKDSKQDTYAAIFRDYGIPIEDIDEAVRRIRASAIKDELVAALDAWAGDDLFKPQLTKELIPIALGVVEDPWRKSYFDIRLRGDKQMLIEVARRPEALAQPPGIIFMLAQVLSRFQGDWERAVNLLRQAQVRYPADQAINAKLAELLTWSDDVADRREGAGYARIVLGLRPENPTLLETLGAALYFGDDFDRAVEVFRQRLKLSDPNDQRDPAKWLKLARALRRKGDWDGALEVYRDLESNKNSRKNPWAYNYHHDARCGIGMVLVEKGAFDEAIALFEEVVRLKQAHYWIVRDAKAGLGWALEGKDKLDEALAAYKQSILNGIDDEKYYFYRPTPSHVSGLIRVLQKQHVPDPAGVAFREVSRLLRQKLEPPDPMVLYCSRLAAQTVTGTAMPNLATGMLQLHHLQTLQQAQARLVPPEEYLRRQNAARISPLAFALGLKKAMNSAPKRSEF